MQPVDIIFLMTIMFKIVFTVGVGFIFKRTGIIDEKLQKGLSDLLVKGIVPFNILEVATCEYTKELAMGVGYSAVICLVYYLAAILIGHLIVSRLKTDLNSKRVIITMIAFANVGFIGFSLTGEIFGVEGNLYCVVYNLAYNMLLYTYGLHLLSGGGSFSIKSIITKSVTVACIFAIIIFFTPVSIPSVVMEGISSIGGTVFPISMIIIGCELNSMSISSLLKNKYAYIVSALRLLILPIVMLVILRCLGFRGTLPRTLVMLTALPCGSMNIIFAESFNCSPKLAATTVVQSMLLMIPALPVIIALSFAFL